MNPYEIFNKHKYGIFNQLQVLIIMCSICSFLNHFFSYIFIYIFLFTKNFNIYKYIHYTIYMYIHHHLFIYVCYLSHNQEIPFTSVFYPHDSFIHYIQAILSLKTFSFKVAPEGPLKSYDL